ncbi:uncharacterized protein LOC124616002 [Schistocerca americana]|uniref:uncharacterized protein LOC124616002 n=1 Tax=Schistocerca americana TaxID=7009 RepID=UPI001F4F9869|nr:uncharacterized protein LOC124616002 [Schistocerca americana]
MKSLIKSKTDVNKTGNIKIYLKNFCNPTIHRTPGACAGFTSVIIPFSGSSSEVIDTDYTFFEPQSVLQQLQIVAAGDTDLLGPKVNKPAQSPVLGGESVLKQWRLSIETDEIMNLSSSELQRLVLSYQLDIMKRKQQKLMCQEQDKQ